MALFTPVPRGQKGWSSASPTNVTSNGDEEGVKVEGIKMVDSSAMRLSEKSKSATSGLPKLFFVTGQDGGNEQ